MDRRNSSDIHPIVRVVAIAMASAVIGGCTNPPPALLTVTDWCWLHYFHTPQRRLVEHGTGTEGRNDGRLDDDRTSGRREPTAATICETVGARIAVTDDGALPRNWEERFLDQEDPAFSELAVAEGRGR